MKRIIHEVLDGCERWVVVDEAGMEHEVFRRVLTIGNQEVHTTQPAKEVGGSDVSCDAHPIERLH